MAKSDILAGSAFVRVYVKSAELTTGLLAARERLQSFGIGIGLVGNLISRVSLDIDSMSAAISNLGRRVATFGGTVTGIGLGMSAAFIRPIKDGSDLAETMSKFGIVFGEQSADVQKWGDTFAAAVGRAKQEVAGFLAGAQDLFIPLGFATDQATQMSKEVTKLAFDLASFNNVADADAMRDLQAALTGSGEVMKKYGVIVNETAVKQRLLNSGIDPEAATDQQKVMARWQIILGGTAAAQGDAIRTASGWANTYKAVFGALKDVSAAIGTALLPVVTPLLARVRDLIRSSADWINQNQHLVRVIAGVAVGLTTIGVAISGAGVGFMAFGKLVGVAGSILSVFGTIASIALPIISLFSLFGPQIMAIGGAAVAAVGSVASLGGAFSLLGVVLGAIGPPLLAIAGVMAGIVVGLAAFAAAGAVAAYALWKVADPITSLLPLLNTVMAAFSNVGAAIMRGDWQGAADAIISGMRQTLLQGISSILTMIQNTMRRLPAFIAGSLSGIGGAVEFVVRNVTNLFTEMWPAIQASAVLFGSFMGDVFDQLPELAGYAIGRLTRAMFHGLLKLGEWITQWTNKVATVLLSTFSSFGPRLLKAIFTGDITGIAAEMGSAMQAAMLGAGLFTGLVDAAAPDFKPSDATKAAWDNLTDKIDGAKQTIESTSSGSVAGSGGGVSTQEPTATPLDKTKLKTDSLSIDIGPLEKYRARLLDLGEAFASGVISEEEFSAGLVQLKRETLNVDATPLEEYRDRLGMLSVALKDGVISTAEWTEQAEEAKRSILGIDPSPLVQFAERSKILQQALTEGAISNRQYAEQMRETGREIFSIDPTPLAALRERILVLNQALGSGAITQAEWTEQFTKSRREILGVEASPLTQFAERVDELKKQLKSGAITFAEYSAEFRKSQQDFLGFDSDPITTYKNKLLELRNALSGGLITKEAFHEAAVAAIPDKIKSVVDETRTPMEKYKKELSELNKLKGVLDPVTFARKEKLLKKQYFSDLQSQGGPTNQSLVTYSAAGAAAAGRGGSSLQDRLLKEAVEAKKVREKQLEEARLARRSAEKLAEGFKMR